MGLIDKQMYLRALEERLNSLVPSNTMHQIMVAADETLIDYEITSTPTGDGPDEDSNELLQFFLNAKAVEGRSSGTIENYRYRLTKLMNDLNTPYRKMTVYHLRGYLKSERERGISPATISGYRSVFRTFFGWLKEEKLIEDNPMRNIAPIKQPEVLKTPYSEIELLRIRETAKCVRDRAIIEFLYSTGCRISEAVQLNRGDIDFHDMSAVVFGKGAKERVVYIGEEAAYFLQKYLDDRNDDNPALFIGLRGERLTQNGVQVMLRTLGIRAGVENVHPHRFRRTLASDLIRKGMPVQEVQKVLGHDKIETTMRYVHVDESTVEASYRRYA